MAVNPENFFNGDGSTTLYPFTFEYLEESDVKVSVDGTVKTQDTDYTFANATTISFNTAPASGSDNIRIYRDTNVDELKSTFFAGSAIRASDLNDNLTQNNYAVQEIKAYTWDNETDTIHSNETWVSSDSQIATTAAMDQRFQDEAAETITSAETWPDNDDTIATTAAIDNRIDTAITNDIGTDGTGITVTDDGDGTITLGLADNAIDFSKIKDADIITDTEQDAGSPSPTNDNLFSALGAARRFDTIVNQAEQSSAVNWEVGKTWLQNDSEKTVRIWDGSAWVAIASGGAFTTLPKVVYVDSVNGNDSLEGHRISNPKRTIKAAIEQINSETDEVGDGSVVIVAPGVYQEAAPIDIQKKNVSIIGQALRSCIVHPTPATEENTLFRLNSGSYVANLTLTGVKASGTRGGNSLDTDSTYGLPTNQGWNFAFYPGATIVKSPYIANCTNFSDSEIDNSDLNAFNPRGGLGGDTDSAPTGGGILVDGNAVSSSSPLRSMVCDSYTHVGLDGPGIFVTNNGYCQATSSYAFFTHYHIKALNGGQANLAASTTDFGRYGLVAQGRSSSAIFTATTTATASDGATTFTIGAPSASGSWFGSATRPQSNMVVDIGGNTYSIIGATANGAGWDVEISRPDPDNLSTNLGLNGAVSSGAAVSFYLRSMIASSGHTMEYVGSGTNYSALPENGGVPIEANEIVELSNGKVWAATTNHQGKFTVGPTFNVDQVTGYVNIANGAIGLEKLIENLDLNSYTLSDSTGNVTIDDTLDMNSNQIVNVAGLTMTGDITMNAQSDVRFADADSSNYVAIQGPATVGTNYTLTLPTSVGNAGEALITDASGNLSWSSNVTTTVDQIIEGNTKAEVIDTGSDGRFIVSTEGQERLRITSDGNLGLGTSSPYGAFHVNSGTDNATCFLESTDSVVNLCLADTGGSCRLLQAGGNLRFRTGGWANTFGTGDSERMVIDSSGRVGIGNASPNKRLTVAGDTATGIRVSGSTQGGAIEFDNNGTVTSAVGNIGNILASSDNGLILYTGTGNTTRFYNGSNEHARIDSSGRLGLGTTAPQAPLVISDAGAGGVEIFGYRSDFGGTLFQHYNRSTSAYVDAISRASSHRFNNGGGEVARIDSSGRLGLGTSTPDQLLSLSSATPRIQITDSDTGVDHILDGTSGIGSFTIKVDKNAEGSSPNFIVDVGGTERLRIDSSGRVGIGTTTPQQKFHVSNGGAEGLEISPGVTSNLNIYYDYNRSGSAYCTHQAQALDFRFQTGASPQEAVRIDSSKRLLVGTSSSSASVSSVMQGNSSGASFGGTLLLARGQSSIADGDAIGFLNFSDSGHVASAQINAARDGGTWTSGSSQPSRLVFSTTADSASSPTERMRISNDGEQNHFGTFFNFRTSRTSAALNAFTVRNDASSISDGTIIFRIWADGDAVLSGTLTQSDVKLKENIVDSNSQWDDIKGIRIRNWNYKKETGLNTDTQIGVVAQELETVSPELVKEKPDFDDNDNALGSTTKFVNTSGLFMKSVKALQEAMERIEQLEANNAQLEARLAALEAN